LELDQCKENISLNFTSPKFSELGRLVFVLSGYNSNETAFISNFTLKEFTVSKSVTDPSYSSRVFNLTYLLNSQNIFSPKSLIVPTLFLNNRINNSQILNHVSVYPITNESFSRSLFVSTIDLKTIEKNATSLDLLEKGTGKIVISGKTLSSTNFKCKSETYTVANVPIKFLNNVTHLIINTSSLLLTYYVYYKSKEGNINNTIKISLPYGFLYINKKNSTNNITFQRVLIYFGSIPFYNSDLFWIDFIPFISTIFIFLFVNIRKYYGVPNIV
jgi:hypothetical protein